MSHTIDMSAHKLPLLDFKCNKCESQGFQDRLALYVHQQQDCAEGETACGKSEDGQHCNCWYDGDLCCRCQGDYIPDYTLQEE